MGLTSTNERSGETSLTAAGWLTIVLCVLGLAASGFVIFPLWNVWAQEMMGKARLADVPTEANLPILEAGRFGQQMEKK